MLHDCIERAELLIVGPAAVYDAAKIGRDRMTQAVLGIDSTIDCGSELIEVLDNEGFQQLTSALGVGVQLGPEVVLDLKHLRYQRLVLVTDRSKDGLHIRNEVLRYLYVYARPILDSGCVFAPDFHLEPGFTQETFEAQILKADTRSLKAVGPSESLETTLGELG